MFVVAVCALAGVAQRGNPTARQVRQRLLQELQPVTLENCTLERFGSPNDGGGYPMCANLLGNIQSAYSVRGGRTTGAARLLSATMWWSINRIVFFNPPGRGVLRRSVRVFHDECIGSPGRRRSMDLRILRHKVRSSGTATPARHSSSRLTSRERNSRRPLVMLDGIIHIYAELAIEIHSTDGVFLELVRKLKLTSCISTLTIRRVLRNTDPCLPGPTRCSS